MQRRHIKKFARLPVTLSDGSVVWMQNYHVVQELHDWQDWDYSIFGGLIPFRRIEWVEIGRVA